MRPWILPPLLTSPTNLNRDLECDAFDTNFPEEDEFLRWLTNLHILFLMNRSRDGRDRPSRH